MPSNTSAALLCAAGLLVGSAATWAYARGYTAQLRGESRVAALQTAAFEAAVEEAQAMQKDKEARTEMHEGDTEEEDDDDEEVEGVEAGEGDEEGDEEEESDDDGDDDDDDEEGDEDEDSEADPHAYHGPTKLVMVVRNDLNMGKGKIAAQCGHAVLGSYIVAKKEHPEHVAAWKRHGQKKIAIKVQSDEELVDMYNKARQAGLSAYIVADAGHTQVDPGTRTVVGIGPCPDEAVDAITGHLKLL